MDDFQKYETMKKIPEDSFNLVLATLQKNIDRAILENSDPNNANNHGVLAHSSGGVFWLNVAKSEIERMREIPLARQRAKENL